MYICNCNYTCVCIPILVQLFFYKIYESTCMWQAHKYVKGWNICYFSSTHTSLLLKGWYICFLIVVEKMKLLLMWFNIHFIHHWDGGIIMNLFQIFLYDRMTTFDHKIIFKQFIKVYRKTVINKPYKNHLSDACIHCSCIAENLLFIF